jgi:RNA polymerase sigma factor (sigma-70 family)
VKGHLLKIFDSDKVTSLVESWINTRDKEILNEILEETRPLAKYIARRYNSESTEDLEQGSLLKIMSSLDHYDPKIANVHTYFSTVIRNFCITSYLKVKNCDHFESNCLEDIENSKYFQTTDVVEVDGDTEVQELISRNLLRFPSLSEEIVKKATRSIFFMTRDGIHNKSRGIVSSLVRNYKLNRIQAKILYRSTITYMRMKHISNSQYSADNKTLEMSLLPELREFLGDSEYSKFICVFSGTTINIK